VKWKRDYVVSPTLAYNHYFGKKAAPAASKAAPKAEEKKK
jgi:hypothetical protein